MPYIVSLVSPKRGAGARLGVGMLRGGGFPSMEINKLLGFLVFGFNVSWFLGFGISEFRISRRHFMFSGRY